MKTKRYIIVNPGRFFTFVTLIVLLAAVIVFTFVYSQSAHSSGLSPGFKEYQVVNGDSLWTISRNHIPEGYDTRKMIYEIKKANNMDDSYIYAGETIKIPLIKE